MMTTTQIFRKIQATTEKDEEKGRDIALQREKR